jgi:type II secretory pathway pseudopilin PulG
MTPAVEVRGFSTLKIRKATGFALIDLIFVIGIIGVLAATATPRLFAARQSAGAASAIGSLRAIASAQLTYALTCGGGFYAPNLTTLGIPPVGSNDPFLSANLTGDDIVTRGGYILQLSASAFPQAPPSCNGLGIGEAGQAYKAGGDPVDVVNNYRYFAINANGTIFEDTVTLFPVMPEVGDPPSGHILR